MVWQSFRKTLIDGPDMFHIGYLEMPVRYAHLDSDLVFTYRPVRFLSGETSH
ncbi:hypothetical protein DSUL_60199 [Desulfovibrionales bacterium]